MIRLAVLFFSLLGLTLPLPSLAAERVLLQSTTSTQNSGLYAYLLPQFEAVSGFDVQVVAVGTGQAIRNAENGDADVLIVHAREAEEAFVAAGFGVTRHELMFNDFVILGPKEDPADARSATNVAEALNAIAASGEPFVSRGDDSGTHKKEMRLWAAAGVDPKAGRYLESGSGMGATIRMATELGAYTLSDRATWIAFNAKADTEIAFEGDPPLNNQYSVILVNPERHPHVNTEGAEALRDWLLGADGQAAIAAYRVAGEQLFFPNAAK